MGGKGVWNQQQNVFIGVLGCVGMRRLVEAPGVLCGSGSHVPSSVGTAGRGQLLPPHLPSGMFGHPSAHQLSSSELCTSSPICAEM